MPNKNTENSENLHGWPNKNLSLVKLHKWPLGECAKKMRLGILEENA
jgi:hypothetical protein